MIEQILKLIVDNIQPILDKVFNGILSGMIGAVGSYLATKHLIKNMEKIGETIKTKKEKKPNGTKKKNHKPKTTT